MYSPTHHIYHQYVVGVGPDVDYKKQNLIEVYLTCIVHN